MTPSGNLTRTMSDALLGITHISDKISRGVLAFKRGQIQFLRGKVTIERPSTGKRPSTVERSSTVSERPSTVERPSVPSHMRQNQCKQI